MPPTAHRSAQAVPRTGHRFIASLTFSRGGTPSWLHTYKSSFPFGPIHPEHLPLPTLPYDSSTTHVFPPCRYLPYRLCPVAQVFSSNDLHTSQWPLELLSLGSSSASQRWCCLSSYVECKLFILASTSLSLL